MTLRHLFAAALASAVFSAGGALADTVRWDMANEYAHNSIHGEAQQMFTETAAAASNGSIEITNHFGAALGYTSAQHLDAVADGALPIANTNMGSVSGIEPIFLLSSLPFLANSIEEARMLWEVARPHYEEAFAKYDQILLYASPWPPAGIWANKPVRSEADLQGLKIRAWDVSGTTTLKAAGAAAIQLTWADVVPQLASGGIEAVLTSAEGGVNSKFWEHLSDFTEINFSTSLNMTHVNKNEWDALTDEQRQALREAAEAASTAAWDGLEELVADNYAEMEENGMTVHQDAPQEFLSALTEAGQVVYDDWLEKVGPEGQEILDAYFAKRDQS